MISTRFTFNDVKPLWDLIWPVITLLPIIAISRRSMISRVIAGLRLSRIIYILPPHQVCTVLRVIYINVAMCLIRIIVRRMAFRRYASVAIVSRIASFRWPCWVMSIVAVVRVPVLVTSTRIQGVPCPPTPRRSWVEIMGSRSVIDAPETSRALELVEKDRNIGK
jgi:hypothetical protein